MIKFKTSSKEGIKGQLYLFNKILSSHSNDKSYKCIKHISIMWFTIEMVFSSISAHTTSLGTTFLLLLC